MRLENTTTTRNQSYADIYISTIHSPGESTFSCACARAELSSPHLELIWSNVLQMFKTSIVVSSPPVHQLNCVGNRLPCSMLLSLVCVLTSFSCASVLWSCHGSIPRLSSLFRHPPTLTAVHAPSPGRFPILHLPAFLQEGLHMADLNSGQPSSLYSAHREYRLLPSKYGWLHLQSKLYPSVEHMYTWRSSLLVPSPQCNHLLQATPCACLKPPY